MSEPPLPRALSNVVRPAHLPSPVAVFVEVALLVIGGVACRLLEAEEHRRDHRG